MYRIAVLAEEKAERQYYAEIIARFCEDKGIFPKIMQYGEQESFFEKAKKYMLTYAIIALPGVNGLCSGASSFTMSHMQDYLVQRFGFFSSRFPTSCRFLFTKASFRRSLSAGIKYLD